MRKSLWGVLCVALALTLAGSACSKKTATTTPSTSSPTPEYSTSTGGSPSSYYLKASGQSSDGKTITIAEAVFPAGQKGWVGIHSDSGGAPGPVIGVSSLLPAGSSTNIKVTLTKPLTATANIFPMLHLEDNNNTTYDFPNGDAPAKVDGKIVVFPIKIEVE